LWLERNEWQATMNKAAEERDKLNDPTHSGPAPAFCRWVEEVQFPQLASRHGKQFEQRIADLTLQLENLQAEIERGRFDRQPEADRLAGEITHLSELLA
jgi:hypothetical protein